MEDLFGVKYPYSKYDSTFFPRIHRWGGALETPGNITYTETVYFLPLKKIVSSARSLILHKYNFELNIFP
jgi:aminopeptidase N